MHISVTGKLGSGKSTVCKILAQKYGYEVYSTGTIQRKMAEKMGLTTLQMNELMCKDNKYDHMIDDAVTELSKETTDKVILFDSRMAWHFAVNSFKVYIYVDPLIAGQRVFADDRGEVEKYSSAEDARDQLLARSDNENRRFKEIYNVDNYDYENYDFVIDSSYASPEIVAEVVYNAYQNYLADKFDCTKMFLCPQAVKISLDMPCEPDDSTEAYVTLENHYNYVSASSKLFKSAFTSKSTFIECKYIKKDGTEKLIEMEVSRTIVYDGRIFKTAKCKSLLNNKKIVDREVTIHSGGVGILPVDAEGYGYFVKQYRYGAQKVLLEVPAGKLEFGEEPLDAALRELSEETGFQSSDIVKMGVAYSSPAILTEKIYMFLALDLKPGAQHTDKDEFLMIEKIRLSDAYQMVLDGKIEDGKSQILIMKAYDYINARGNKG